MRTIRSSSSVLVFWQDLVFLEAALLAEEDTKPLAAVVTPVLEEFPAVLKVDLDTRRGVIQASARAFIADASVDSAIRRLFSAVLALVEQDRQRQQFLTLFPTHIGDIVRHALRKQLDVAKDLVAKLGLTLYTADFSAPQTKALNAAIKRGAAALDDVGKAELARAQGRIDIRTWKDEANAARLTVYGQLLALSAKTGRGKAWAEGFFPRVSAVTAEEGEEVVEPEGPEGAEPVGEEKAPK